MLTMGHAFRVKKIDQLFTLVLYVSAAIVISACQKSPSPEANSAPAESANAASGVVSSAPTGLVKNATRHTEETANVTRWWDIAEKKTAVQTAKEEKIAKEARDLKQAQDAKLALEEKNLAAKTAASALAQVKPPVVTAAVPVLVKPAELAPPPVAAIKTIAPAPAPAPAPEVLKFLSGTQPIFPIAAARAGHTQGMVSARLSVEKNGSVSKVEIIDSNPKKVFDREVISTLSFWKYAAISNPQTKVVEIQFKADN